MSALFWVLIGFMLALIWDKYKDWQRFRTSIRWVRFSFPLSCFVLSECKIDFVRRPSLIVL